MPTIVAFLDVLGFSSYTEEDLAGAHRLLRHQEFILRQKLDDGNSHPASSYTDPSLSNLADAHLIDSFRHFLPFSDSTFVVGESPDKFVRQLSHFLIECLQLVGHVYNDANDPARPEAVEVADIASGRKHSERWYPPLWRGGLATGDVETFKVTAIENGTPIQLPNLAGVAVVKAVRAEKAGKCRGPRLLCESGFEKNFGANIQPYFRPVTDTVSELLWPAFIYVKGNNPHEDMNHFHDLWHSAVGLWRSKRGKPSFEHYDEFLKLLVRSFLRWAELCGCEKEAKSLAQRHLASDIGDALVQEYMS
jgi:hypothetical protein